MMKNKKKKTFWGKKTFQCACVNGLKFLPKRAMEMKEKKTNKEKHGEKIF
jgi:hypothetical protein